MKNCKRFVVMLLVIVSILSSMAVSASASVWRTGDYVSSGYTTFHTVTLSNSNRDGYIRIHAYTCSRGRGHSGACRNSSDVSGRVGLNVDISLGNRGHYPALAGWNYYKLPKGSTTYRVRFPATRYAHWAIEGTSNIRSIS